MATADLKLIYSGGGSFKPTFFSGTLQVNAGATGTILTITPPAGKKVRLIGLCCSTGTEANITVSTDTGIVVGPLTLAVASGSSVGQFVVASNLSIGGAPSTNGIPYIESLSALTIAKTSGSTTNPILYSYAFGD